VQTSLSARCDPEPDPVSNVNRLVLPGSADNFVHHFRSARSCSIHRVTTLTFIARVCEARNEGKEGVVTVTRLLALKASRADDD